MPTQQVELQRCHGPHPGACGERRGQQEGAVGAWQDEGRVYTNWERQQTGSGCQTISGARKTSSQDRDNGRNCGRPPQSLPPVVYTLV